MSSEALLVTHLSRKIPVCLRRWLTDDCRTISWFMVNWTIGKKTSVTFELKYKDCYTWKWIWKCRLQNGGPILAGSVHWYSAVQTME